MGRITLVVTATRVMEINSPVWVASELEGSLLRPSIQGVETRMQATDCLLASVL